ncbi:cell wall hydrolase [Gluconacetobacter azotocaptans]|uniref:Cell wall hydrolase n=2 Tax=Gluconacetobacter azotocaptans TaxID=142834 RepID=A0A7W4PFT2_9PROT|nr:cell wall hydrolase [Gluconacetobacter azotocaptans]
MQAVLNVIGNRAAQPGWWGASIGSCCLKPWQFSCWLRTDPNRTKLLAVTDSDPQFRQALALAECLSAGDLEDLTCGSDHYFADGIEPLPIWADGRRPRCTIGRHVFYRCGLQGNEQ